MEKLAAQKIHQYNIYVKAISIFSIIIGVLVLIGYQFNIMVFKSITPFWLDMKANTAICFILSGITLWIMNNQNLSRVQMATVKFVAFILIVFSLLTFTEYFLSINLKIDQLFFKEQKHIEDIIYPGRTSVATTLCLFFLGISFLFTDKKFNNNFIAQIAILIILTIAFLGLLGYFYNINTVYGITYYTKMAFHTSITLIFLCVGILISRPNQGLGGLLTSNTVGGWSLRILLPIMVTVPTIIGFLENLGEKLNLYSPAFGDNIQLTFTVVTLALIVIWHSYKLNTIIAPQNNIDK